VIYEQHIEGHVTSRGHRVLQSRAITAALKDVVEPQFIEFYPGGHSMPKVWAHRAIAWFVGL
jgi:hypothetical protein